MIESSSSQTPPSNPPLEKASKSQSKDLASSRTNDFVQEPSKSGNPLAILPYQTKNVDDRRREMKVEMMDYIAGFNDKFHR